MDDFGRSLERDYGLGRGSKGRIGTRSNRGSSKNLYHFENSTGFSGSFSGRSQVAQLAHHEASSSFREGRSSPRSWSNNSRPSSYSVYDEVFSSNTQSTIPLFEDVFRVHSSRMKVSELRENDLFRGVSDFRRNVNNRSRLTYEDIFGENSPEEFTNPFNVAGSKPSSSGRQSPAAAPQHERRKERAVEKSSKSRSRSATPRKDSTGESSRSHAEAIAQPPVEVEARNGDHHGAPKIQGSFLGMSQSFKREESFEKRREPAEPAEVQNHHVESPATSSPDGVQRAWLSIGEVSLITKPSENPPPLRSAPGRSSSSRTSADGGGVFETAQADSGPPPLRVPPPIIDNVEQTSQAQAQAQDPEAASSGGSELLERVLRERSAHGEISIREKVLDWQKHNLSQQQAEEERQRESFRRRNEALEKLREEREEMERIAAEVEAAAAEQARVRAERAAAEDLERDARATLMKQQQEQQEEHHQEETIQFADETSPVSDEKTVADASEAGQTRLNESPNLTNGASEGGAAAFKSENNSGSGYGQALSDGEKSNPGEVVEAAKETSTGIEEENGEAPATTAQMQTNEVVPEANTDNESSIGIDTISSTSENGSPNPVKQEPAPETPERSEELHARHEKSSKSSEVELLGEEQDEKQKSSTIQQEDGGAARNREGRTLVARITEEAKERAAENERRDRRTRPRLKQEDHSRRSGGGAARVSLREQLEKERVARLERSRNESQPQQQQPQAFVDREAGLAAEAKLRAERSLVERITAEVRERAAASARAEQERAERLARERERAEKEQEKLAREAAEQKERERIQRLHRARERERERLERLEREREKERERLARELEREREIEREKDRVGLEEKAAKERAEAEAEAARIKMERAAVERATAEARARAERVAYERAVSANGFSESSSSRPASVPKQRFANSASMPTSGSAMENGIRRTTSSTNLDSERYSSSSNSREFQQEFQEIKGETPERRKARLERYHRTLNRAAQALAQKNKRDLEVQTEQAERQRLAERLDADIKRWSVGKDGNIRALLSTLQYVLWPESGWKQVTLTELISPATVKKAYRRATLCVHPDKMQQKHASVQQKYIAEKVFHILQVAWNKFNSQEAL